MKKLSVPVFLLSLTIGSVFAQQEKISKIQVCVIDSGKLKSVDAEQTENGEVILMVNGKKISYNQSYSETPDIPGYAKKEKWYDHNDSIKFQGSYYKKYGLPRVITFGSLQKIGAYKGVGIYGENNKGQPSVLYIPVSIGCEFQPYKK